ncbi:MAG: YqgE/AlgH family protein [Sphingomonadaceae bacterium]|uniref:YqgE/AlgH family protein n=1 Tax=Thermaurantiacus sp. TaxID=2820283 RepID=UPI00298F10FD|nr:YqgE/AlgH family protein [Thermaurantiacus sp.]MCS6987393.1 YqgE/AlgH family protein [Sphingomonadaceae bacterium]MDW8415313.1 YqgE/AlgH family protein [Thermaurantiacus sp.]
MDGPPYLSGQFLLAMPGMPDPRFARSVVAMCAHDAGGAFGLCLHAEIEGLTVPDLMRQLDVDPGETPPVPVLAGGPVEPNRGFVLHTPDFAGQDTRFVAGRWALTATRDVLEAIARGRGPRHWVVALGYAGWGEGQLEQELSMPGWFTCPGSLDLIFATPTAERWQRAFREAGVDVAMLSAGAGRA